MITNTIGTMVATNYETDNSMNNNMLLLEGMESSRPRTGEGGGDGRPQQPYPEPKPKDIKTVRVTPAA